MNSVKLYSNGTAVVRREYAVDGKELKLSIPVRKDDLADVVSSIAVFGRVSLPHPPSYSPKNAVVSRLAIDPEHVVADLAVKLRGGMVRLALASGRTAAGRLMGRQTFHERTPHGVVERFRIVLQTEEGAASFDEGEVRSLQFDDPTVKAEVDKALDRAFQEIKPESSLVELTIVPEPDETTAVVSYAVPVAAWKIRYQLRRTGETWELEGQAVVDNDTDDDWKDVVVSVVSGDPITFDTDLAEIRRPRRSRVNVVSEEAVGAVVMSEANAHVAARRSYAPREDMKFNAKGDLVKVQEPEGPQGMFCEALSADADGMDFLTALAPARVGLADVYRRGAGSDFAFFTSPTPVTIGAQRSAVVPLFRTPLSEARSVWVHKEDVDPHRPYQAVQFVNPLPHALGFGVCEIFEDGDFLGKSVFHALLPGDEGFLAHAREMGVRVEAEVGRESIDVVGISIREGAAVTQKRHAREGVHQIWNRLDKPVELFFETRRLLDSKAERTVVGVCEGAPREEAAAGADAEPATIEVERVGIESGERLTVVLPPLSKVVVRIKEVLHKSSKFDLSHDGGWILEMISAPKHSLSADPAVQGLVALKRRLVELKEETAAAEKQADVLRKEQARTVKLIQVGGKEQVEEWRRDLGKAEAELRRLTREAIPDFERRVEEMSRQLAAGVAGLALHWSENPPA